MPTRRVAAFDLARMRHGWAAGGQVGAQKWMRVLLVRSGLLAAVCAGLRSRWWSGPVDFETPAGGRGDGVQVCLV